MTEGQVPQVALRQHRDRTIALLCQHFAGDRLDMAELESRLDRAHKALTVPDLDALVSDLTVAAPERPATPVADEVARRGRALGEAIRASRTYFAFMGGVERRGAWTPARRNMVFAVMGGVELDFREVDLPPGETEIFLFCVMGGAAFIVPPDVAVDSSGAIAIMGGIEHGGGSQRPRPDAPVLKITGFCMMGGAEITVRHSGETARDASRRQKEERKLQRERNKRLGDPDR
ncbi:MAG TPA: DUF1707 domain-containing protein [Longimicrobiales bacterium]|nr:DUF1707 domain-containing protein [Longimicrobiales bacterium]